MEEKENARTRQQQRRAAVAMLGAAKEVALFFARNAARRGDLVQRGDDLGDISLDQSLRAEARFWIEQPVPHAVDIAVNAFAKDDEKRSAELRVGKECVGTGGAGRGAESAQKKK